MTDPGAPQGARVDGDGPTSDRSKESSSSAEVGSAGTTPRRDLTFWLGLVVGLALVAGSLQLLHQHVLAGALHDLDAPWHLAAGRVIVETGDVPRADPLCFTTDGLDWVNLNWLSQAALYRSFLAWGYEGPLALGSVMFVAALGLSAVGIARGRPLLRLTALLVVALTLYMVRGIRPQVATYPLLAGLVLLLQPRAGAPGGADPAPALGPWRCAAAAALLLLWDHVHGGFLWGWSLLAADGVGAVISSRRARGPLLPRRALELAALIAVGLLGFVTHPHGFAALEHALLYTQRLGPHQFARINELQGMNLSTPADWVGATWSVLLVLGWALAPERVRARDVVVGLVFVAMSVSIRRSIVGMVIVTAPVFVGCWSVVLERARAIARPLGALERVLRPGVRALPWSMVLATAAWVCVWVPARRAHTTTPGDPTHPVFDTRLFPGQVAAWLKARGGGRILNEYGVGGLLGWALYPSRRVFVDGRGDLHARGRAWEDYLTIVDLAPGWEERLSAYEVELVVMPSTSRLTAALRSSGWPVALETQGMTVLERPTLAR